MVSPMLTYVLPILIAYQGGKMVGGPRGAVMGAIATVGVICGSEYTMLMGAKGIIDPAIMVTHVGGLNSVAETTCKLPHIKGGKKLAYTQFNMPMTAIEDFGKLGETDPFFKELDACCKAHKGLWNAEAERMIFEHFGVTMDELQE